MAEPITLRLEVETDSDEATLDRITRELLTELKDTELESAALAKKAVSQAGAKAVDAVTVGAVVITVLPTMLAQLLGFLRDWAARASNRTVRIKRQEQDRSIEVEYNMTNTSEEDIRHMLDVLGGFIQNDD